MKIIKEGVLPDAEDRVLRLTCSHCKTVFEVRAFERRKAYAPQPSDSYLCPLPGCNHVVFSNA